jgi:hypothetical protein
VTDPALVRLAQAVVDCREEFEKWGMLNTYGRTTEELVEIQLGYRVALQRYLEAQQAYDAALGEAVRDQVSKPDA